MKKARTIGELRDSNYQVVSVREEVRRNLMAKIKAGERLFPGLFGYEETVVPQIENAVLAGQDMIYLGERGQAKTRIMRSLGHLLDEEIPVIAGCEINDSPYQPICKSCRERVEKKGDRVEIVWLGRESRYGEKLATPDTTIADLIGEVDPVRVAEGRYLSDELTIHYGLIPRTNRGIFCINELPDLAERIQVGLFNIMEERDVQVRGYKIRLPLDVYIVASANAEDYTNRGRIITPLKDRYGAQIRTHYPTTHEVEIEIVRQERQEFPDDVYQTSVPSYMEEIIAEISSLARRSPHINQRSGVSVRVSIANYETLVSNALRRAIRHDERQAVPRISDLPHVLASTAGKIELETIEEASEAHIIEELTKKAVLNTFNRHFKVEDFAPLTSRFETGLTVETSDAMPAAQYMQTLQEVAELREGVSRLGGDEDPATIAAALEFILEGLHLNKKLNKDKMAAKSRYRG